MEIAQENRYSRTFWSVAINFVSGTVVRNEQMTSSSALQVLLGLCGGAVRCLPPVDSKAALLDVVRDE